MRASPRAAAITAALSLFNTTPVLAQDATLTARSGGLSVSGRLISHDGTVYRIDTEWGRLTVDAAAVDCTGPGCPDLMRFAPELRLAVEPWLANRLLRPLAHSFARAEGLSLDDTGDLLELMQGDRVQLRIRLLPLGGPAGPVLATGDADAALAVAERSGRLIAQLPLTLASAPDAPAGPLPLPALRNQRGTGGGWDMLGAMAQPLVWHTLASGSTLDQATSLALGPLRADAARSTTPDTLANALRRDPWGLALLPLPLPDGLVPRQIIQGCGLIADLSAFAAAAGDHPLLMPVSWIEAGHRLPPIARAFADHLSQPAGQRALAAAGLQAPSVLLRQPLTAAGIRLTNALADPNPDLSLADRQAALALLAPADRLAMTFRLDPRSGGLDAASRGALDGLSAHLASGAFAGHDILLVGFSDSAGPARDNLAQGEARAQALRDALLATTPDLPPGTTLRAESLGEAMPIACNDTAEGRRLNRRVEVWLRPTR